MARITSIPLAFFLLVLLGKAAAQNYNEQLVPAFTLPKLMVTSVRAWEEVRRPEILRMFEDNIYGQFPRDQDSVRYLPFGGETLAMGGKALLKQVDVQVFRQGRSVTIHLLMFIPAKRTKPAPLFLLINNRSKNNTDPFRTKKTEFWPAEQLIDSGYAIAAFHVGDLAPDHKVNYVNGVLQLYPEQLAAENGMRAIGAWAWGATKLMDYLQTEKRIDGRRVAIVGHSRGGKAALWASAQDSRFWMCFASCSGNTGAALSRRRFGETISRINETFPYWFCPNYKNFNNREDALPVDQHMLIALSAPRPVYTTNATEDRWADPKGSYLSLKYATPAYSLYRKTPALPPELVPPESPVLDGPLGYHLRRGIHDLNAYDWGNFIAFANHYLKQK